MYTAGELTHRDGATLGTTTVTTMKSTTRLYIGISAVLSFVHSI